MYAVICIIDGSYKKATKGIDIHQARGYADTHQKEKPLIVNEIMIDKAIELNNKNLGV